MIISRFQNSGTSTSSHPIPTPAVITGTPGVLSRDPQQLQSNAVSENHMVQPQGEEIQEPDFVVEPDKRIPEIKVFNEKYSISLQ
jgi:hypothetical protein